MATMEAVEKTLTFIWNVLIFALVSILFLPALLIVNTLQEFWAKLLKDLFDY